MIIYDNLKFLAQSSGNEIDFSGIEDPVVFLNNIRTKKSNRKSKKIT